MLFLRSFDKDLLALGVVLFLVELELVSLDLVGGDLVLVDLGFGDLDLEGREVLGGAFVFSNNVISDSFLIVESTLTGELWADDLLFWGLVVVLIENFSFSVVGECV